MSQARRVAYFSMEIAVDSALPTYAGGLGVLAGDTLRSCADLSVPILAVTLLHRRGYLTQACDASGWQRESDTTWNVEAALAELPPRVSVRLEGRDILVRAWRYDITGLTGYRVPVFFLDTDLPENAAWDRTLTHFLYGGDASYRLCQEAVLGVGGVRMVRALGFSEIARFHLNEGHAALLTLELLREAAQQNGHATITATEIEAVRARCIFTTHTPVRAAHDRFPMPLVAQLFGRRAGFFCPADSCRDEFVRSVLEVPDGDVDPADLFSPRHTLNMTHLALSLSHYVNGVARRHAEVSRDLLRKPQIEAITNGVHAATWTSPPFQALFDRHIPGWRADNFSLRYAHSLAAGELWAAHQAAKTALCALIRERTGVTLDPDALTLGCARRSTAYKRLTLLLTDPMRLKAIGAKHGRLQILFGGKAHPNDYGGKEIIQQILRARDSLRPEVEAVFLENYDMALARPLVAGVDLWVNTPQPPFEASGTSGMKAALNGVPSLSVLDGWWVEGCIEGATGWAIDAPEKPGTAARGSTDAADATSLYQKLDDIVAPLFCHDRPGFVDVMRHTIALNGSFFNTQRMVQQYVLKAYFE